MHGQNHIKYVEVVVTVMSVYERRRGIRPTDCRCAPLQQKHALKLSAITQNWVAGPARRKPAQGGFGRQLVSGPRVGRHRPNNDSSISGAVCSAVQVHQQLIISVDRLSESFPKYHAK